MNMRIEIVPSPDFLNQIYLSRSPSSSLSILALAHLVCSCSVLFPLQCLGARKSISENKRQAPAIVFCVYCLNKYLGEQLKKFCSAPAARRQNMLIANGVVEVSGQTPDGKTLLVSQSGDNRSAANLCVFTWRGLKIGSPCWYHTRCSWQFQWPVLKTGRTSAFPASSAEVCWCCVNYLWCSAAQYSVVVSNIHSPSFHLDHTEAEIILIRFVTETSKKSLALLGFKSSTLLNIVTEWD